MLNLFGSKSNGDQQSVDWSALLSLFEDDDRRAVAEQVFPENRRESFLAALRRLDASESSSGRKDLNSLSSGVEQNAGSSGSFADRVCAAGRQLDTADKLVGWPTVAVAGMLNSGKTSLVATFLSEQGRLRTLRGFGNDQGTHRFVLWLPAAWQKDSDLYELLMQRIADAIGRAPEMLSDDPKQAHQQYNNRVGDADLLSIPLVATDAALDQVGMGLLDCPDIVSDEAFGLGSPQQRRDLLGKAATLCSAFLVVTSAESSRDTSLADLLRIASDLMPGVPRFLAVNKVRPQQTPDQVFDTFTPMAKSHGIDTIYGAYDFEIPDSHPFIPVRHVGAHAIAEQENSLPTFFSLRSTADENPPASVDADRMLDALPIRLDRATLFESFRYSLEQNLRSAVWEDGVTMVDRDAAGSVKRTSEAQRCLLDATLDFFARRDSGQIMELRLHQNERILRQLSESFALTAPWYARWSVRLNARIKSFSDGIGGIARKLNLLAGGEKLAGEIKDRISRKEYGGLLVPMDLVESLQRHGGGMKLPHYPAISGEHGGGEHGGGGELSPSELSPSALSPSALSPGGSTRVGANDAPEAPTRPASAPDPVTGLNSDSVVGVPLRQSAWSDAAEAAILRFEREDFTSLDPRRLDEAVREMWKDVSNTKKLAFGMTPLAAMLAALGAAFLIPLDGGATLTVSITELFAAGGLTTLATMWAGKRNTRNVEQQAARQQVADFQAVLCDCFGVARVGEPAKITVSGVTGRLPVPKIAVATPGHPGHPGQPRLPLYQLREEFKQELERLLPRNPLSR